MFASHGHKVIGVDINENVIDALNRGEIIIEEPYLDILVQAAVTSGNLKAYSKPEEADVFIIAVPTPLIMDNKADLSYIQNAAEAILPYLRKGNVVVLESTSPTGTTEELLVPILAKSGLIIGKELFIGYSPERVLPGQILPELIYNNRIIGGINIESAEMIRDVYKTFVRGEIYLTSTTTAEMCKMTENTFRDVNIALANELAKICEKIGINVWEVIALSNRHPRVNIHQPGPGVGGHCLAVDPWFIVEKVPDLSQIIELARNTNNSMPNHVMNRIEEMLKDVQEKKKVTLLGITYKPNIDDMRESPIIKLVELLEEKQYEISIVDPHVKQFKYIEKDILKAAKGSDLLVLAVNHDAFKEIHFKDLYKVMRNKKVFDTKNYFSKESLQKEGFEYYLLGEKTKEYSMPINNLINEVAIAR